MSLATSTVKLGQRPSPVTLTDAAVAKVTDLLAQEGDEGLALRVAVTPRRCSGYSYEMFFDSEIADDDIVRTFGPVRVVVDPESADLIKGATLDYRDGLQEAGFHITNPNAYADLRLRLLVQLSCTEAADDGQANRSLHAGGPRRAVADLFGSARRCLTDRSSMAASPHRSPKRSRTSRRCSRAREAGLPTS